MENLEYILRDMREKIKRLLLHLIAPTRCPLCGDFIRPADRFCEECGAGLRAWSGKFNVPGSDSFTAAFEYNGTVKPAVMLLKTPALKKAVAKATVIGTK